MSHSIDQNLHAYSNDHLITIEQMPTFNQVVREKNIFLFSITAGFLFIYILLPILAFQPFLQKPIMGAITGVWFYSAGLFLMTITLCTLYIRQAAKFDKKIADVIAEYQQMKLEEAP
ncbi:MAG: DUF485 domain-containing protein [Wohlfahrtiimonas sp.]